ncbi:MAG: hypothetical protein MI922_24415 [Bacteroidales bacterium]|nr:hypothetical protein [Bacteroidales bacterium]
MEINKKNRTELKQYFLKNTKPTEQQFAEFIDAGINQAEDGIVKSQGNSLALIAEGTEDGPQEILDLFSDFSDDHPKWSVNLNPRVNSNDPGSNRSGLNLKDTTGESRLYIKSGNGSVGIGTIEPESKLTIKGTNSGSLVSVISNQQQHSRIFEVNDENGDGVISVRDGNTHETIRLNGDKNNASFFLGKVGIGTDNPSAPLQVSNNDSNIKITNTKSGGKASLILNHGNSTTNQWEFNAQDTSNSLEIKNGTNRMMVMNNEAVEFPRGFSFGLNQRDNHLEMDGAFYKHSGDVYLTVDNNFHIRDKGNRSKMHFQTNNARIGIGDINPSAPISVSGSGKNKNPDSRMHITKDSILFGGDNAGKIENSGKISAGNPHTNRLNIYGMSTGPNVFDRKVEIHSEGGLYIRGRTEILKEYVAAFSVSLKTNQTGPKNPLKFEAISYNHGNHFKNNNHFIAPVKGVYMFTMCMRHNTDNGDVGWRLRLNDTDYVNGTAGDERAERSQLIARTKLHMNSRTVITLLNAGDRVHVEQFGSGGNDNFSSGFQGLLLQALFSIT